MDSSTAERRVVTVRRTIAVAPQQVFALLTDPVQHSNIDSSGMVQGRPKPPDRLELGSEFSMAMKQAGLSYRSVNRVVEFEADRRIAWETWGEWRDRVIVGGQRWRYHLTSVEGGTLVEHSYVWGYARFALLTIWLPRFPQRMERAMTATLERLDRALTS